MKYLFIFFCFCLFNDLFCSQHSACISLNEEIPNQPFIYEGQNPREMISFDPQNSIFFDLHIEKFIDALSSYSSLETLLTELTNYVVYKIFDPRLCNQKTTYELINNYCHSKTLEIPLEVFLKARTGLCRHIALCTAVFLDKLIKKGIIQGKVFLIRDQTPQGRHAWCLLLCQENAWHIDPFWRMIEDAKTSKGWDHLCNRYGQETMESQREKWKW